MAQLPAAVPPALQHISFLEPLPVYELAQTSPLQPTRSSPGSPSFFCSVCKKPFSSQNTWNTHFTSQRHLKLAKTAEQPSSPAKSPSKPQLSRAETGQLLAQAAAWKREAEQKVKATPVKACNLLLRAGKAFLQAAQLQDAALCYELIIATQKSRTTDWSSEALMRDGKMDVLVHSSLHLARLYFPFIRALAAEYAQATICYLFGPAADISEEGDSTIASLRRTALSLTSALKNASKAKATAAVDAENPATPDASPPPSAAGGSAAQEEALMARTAATLGECADMLSLAGPLHLLQAIFALLLVAHCRKGDVRVRVLRRAAHLYQERLEHWFAIDCLLEAEEECHAADDATEALYLCVLHDDRVRMQRALAALPDAAAPSLRRIAQAALSLSLLEIDEAVVDEPAQANEARMGHLLKKVRARLL